MDSLARIPHRPPFVMVDRIVTTSADEVVGEKLVSADDPWLRHGMGGALLVEALAQTAACMVGRRVGAHDGRLVAAAGFSFAARAAVGDRVTLRVKKTAQLGALVRVTGEARVGEVALTTGELTLAIIS